MTSQKDLQRYLIKVEEVSLELEDYGCKRCGPYLYDPGVNLFLLPEPNESTYVSDEVVFKQVDFEDIEDYLKENHYEIWCKVLLNVS